MARKKRGKPMDKQTDHSSTVYSGPLKFDLAAVALLLRILGKGKRQGLLTALAGMDDVVVELADAAPTCREAAGVSSAVYQEFCSHTDNINQLREVGLPIVEMAEVIVASLALEEDARQRNLAQMGDSIRSTARRARNTAVEGPFQKTLAYKSQLAMKSLKARQQKAAAAAATSPAADA